MKTCTKCRIEKPKSSFGKMARAVDGLQLHCKSCLSAYHKEYFIKNKEHIDAQRLAYRAQHATQTANRGREWRLSDAGKRWVSEYLENAKETIAARAAAHYAKHKPRITAQKLGWRLANKDKSAEYQRVNLDVTKRCNSNRRVRKAANGGKLSRGIVSKLFDAQKGMCACCGQPLGVKYHLDHIMPLALGGSNSDDNVQLLLPRCNQSKSDKHPAVYAQECKNRIINALV